MRTDCIILGGGAAGLTAAAALAPSGLRITVVERLDRVGKKILSTGNGRCNLSNEDMRASLYAPCGEFVHMLYEQTPPEDVRAFFASLGLMTVSEEGRIYPRSMQASAMLDVLRIACERENVTLLTGQSAVSLMPSRRGGWSVQLDNGEGLFAPVVLCAMGGSAAPSMGTDGSGVRLLTQLGHSAIPACPALVQLKGTHPALKSLKGIRVQAALTLLCDERPAAEETGELLFADYGVSGVCVFQLSRFASRALAAKQTVRLSVNLLPEVKDVAAWLNERIAARPALAASQLFTGVFHRLLAQTLLKEANIRADDAVSTLSAQSRSALCSAITALSIPITGTQGFAQAQVTAGGVTTDEVAPETMASRLFDGLYLAGEILNVDGPCGGYNLHFAFAGALTAARAIRSQLAKA